MSKFEKIVVISIVLILIAIGNLLLTPTPYQGGIADPIQVNLENEEIVYASYENEDIPIVFLAEYTIEGIIKSKKEYSDYSSRVAKYDFALAWGSLNQKEIDKHLRYSQRGRWYYYVYDRDISVSGKYIAEHSANVHIIHQDSLVLKEIEKLKTHDHIRLTGYLVSVNFDDGPWESSLTRHDTGKGACEIMYVTRVELLE